MNNSFLKILAGCLLAVWLVLVLFGKGGFVHMILLNGLAIVFIDLVCVYRRRVRQ